MILSCGKDASRKISTPEIIKTKAGIEMVKIPAGWFQMGSDKGKPDESPVHKVWVDSFLMDKYEVTQDLYDKLVLGNPSHFKGADNPIEQMRWSDAALYCNARSKDEGLELCYNEETGECNFQANGYRLPTEAEWEYACRAVTKGDYFFGNDPRMLKEYAWYAENSIDRTHPVGQKKPNPWGLYDMYGNVTEWCNDRYDENYYKNSPDKNPRGPEAGKRFVLRGSAWSSSPDVCRSSSRAGENPGFQDACFARDNIGFRCVRKADSVQQSAISSQLLAFNIQHPASSTQNPVSSIQYQASSIKHPASRTGFIYDEIYLKHKTGPSHPESPKRLESIVARVNKLLGTDTSLKLIKPETPDNVAQWITAIHTPQYVERVRRSCREGIEYLDSTDTPVSYESYDVALAAVGGVLTAIDKVMAGEVSNAFCAIRPPGHHALKDRAMGFCLFNNVAIAARYIQKKYKLSKILIVDWDVHHGNGTQDAFYDDPTVLYFSTHQYPFYPGTGSKDEKGIGKGLGYTINVPFPAGTGDKEYKRVFDEILRPKALEFDPDFVLISAGFDAHKDDPLGGMNITAQGFGELTKIVKDIADNCCNGRIVSVLEGGYDLDGLADSVEMVILALSS